MQPEIEFLQEKKLVGKKLQMSLSGNKTAELWQSFMPRRKEIRNTLTNDLFSVQVYDESTDFGSFDPDKTFFKWAAAEVADFDLIPDGMETFILPGGLYAVFKYRGAATSGAIFFRYIFCTWLPSSGYSIDNRPHFEILGKKYKNEDPDSEEQVWIPVRPVK